MYLSNIWMVCGLTIPLLPSLHCWPFVPRVYEGSNGDYLLPWNVWFSWIVRRQCRTILCLFSIRHIQCWYDRIKNQRNEFLVRCRYVLIGHRIYLIMGPGKAEIHIAISMTQCFGVWYPVRTTGSNILWRELWHPVQSICLAYESVGEWVPAKRYSRKSRNPLYL